MGHGLRRRRSRPRDSRHRISEAGHDRTLLADAGLVQRRLGHRQQHDVRDRGARGTAEFLPVAEREADDVGERHHLALHERGVHDDCRAAHVQCRRHGALAVQSGPTGFGFAARIGGDGNQLAYDTSNIRPEVERYAAMGRLSYDISDKFHWFGELAYSHSDSANTPANGGLGPGPPPNCIRQRVSDAGRRRGARSLGGNLNRIFMPAVMSANNTTETTTTRFVTGFESEIGTKWTWDAYFQHGENENHQRLFHNMVGSLSGAAVRQYDFLRWALDAVHSNRRIRRVRSSAARRSRRPDVQPTRGRLRAAQHHRQRPRNSSGDRLRVSHAQGGQQVQAGRGRRELPKQHRSRAGRGRSRLRRGSSGGPTKPTRRTTSRISLGTRRISSRTVWIAAARSTCSKRTAKSRCRCRRSCRPTSRCARRATRRPARRTRQRRDRTTSRAGRCPLSTIALEWLRVRATVSRDVRAAGFRELFLPRVTVQSGVFPANVTNPWTGGASDQFAPDYGRQPRSRARDGRYQHDRHRVLVRQAPVLGRLVRDRLGRTRSRRARATSRSSTNASGAEAAPATESRATGRGTSRPSIRARSISPAS